MIRRSDFLKALSSTLLLPEWGLCANTGATLPYGSQFVDGMKVLDDVFWSPEIANWLDRPGRDLRGHFEGRINPPWWSCANAVEAMVEYMDLSGTSIFDERLRDIHAGNVLRGSRLPKVAEALRKHGKWTESDEARLQRKMKALDPRKVHGTEFRNEYLDDSGWWGIAWLRFYGRTGDPAHLKTAEAIQRHMAANWRAEGGVSWAEEEGKQEPNAITNSLFIILSARLHATTRQAEALEWATKALAWEKQAKLYDGTAIVDRPGHKGDYWTYNQGAYLGALEALHAATGKAAYLEEAADVATTILHKSGIIRKDGVLFEKLGGKGWDVSLFKGICARYFGILARSLKKHHVRADVAQELDRVLEATATAILKAPMKDRLYPLEWHQPARAEVYNFNTHLSALIAFCAVTPSTAG